MINQTNPIIEFRNYREKEEQDAIHSLFKENGFVFNSKVIKKISSSIEEIISVINPEKVYQSRNNICYMKISKSLHVIFCYFEIAGSNEAYGPSPTNSFSNDKTKHCDFEIFGSSFQEIRQFEKILYEKFSAKLSSYCKWFYRERGDISSTSIEIKNNSKKIEDCFYPYIKEGVDNFIDNYLASPEAILILYGPPGTGKTSFLRHLLSSRQLESSISFDESILKEDSIFVNFMQDDTDIFVIEDADNILHSREKDHNPFMSKFLNVSEGLIKMPKKKMIFTTNIVDKNMFDSAFIREGRCFSFINFRKLSREESKSVVQCLNTDIDLSKKDEWSLSELFTGKEKIETSYKFGF